MEKMKYLEPRVSEVQIKIMIRISIAEFTEKNVIKSLVGLPLCNTRVPPLIVPHHLG